MADGPVVEVKAAVSIDDAATKAEAQRAGQQIGAGVGESASEAAKPGLDQLKKLVSKAVQDAMKPGASGAKQATSAFAEFGDVIDQVSRAAVTLTKALQDVGAGQRVIGNAVRGQTEALRRASIEGTTVTQSAAKERTAIIQREASLSAIAAQTAGQRQVIAARSSGQARVAIIRGVVDSIGRLEKGLGATVAGIARTTVSAISRTFSGLGSGLSSIFRRADSSAAGGNSTLKSTLRERESVIRSSFSRQEKEVRESITRQQKQLESIRGSTQTGLLGAANRSGALAGIVGGLGIGLLAKSTFTIGADFTRGLAVLDAQLGLTDAQMKAVRQTSIDLGNDISLPGVSALDAAQAIQLLAKQFAALGPAAAEAGQAAAKGTLQLAKAAGVGAEEAAQVVGAAVNVFGVAADQATAVADQVAGALKNAAGVSFDDFAQAFRQGSSVFAQFVVPAEGATDALTDFNTALAIMARQGLVGSDAGTSLKNFFLQANRGTDDANTALAEISKRAGTTGTAFFDAAGKSRRFTDTLDILRRGLVGLTDEQRNNTLQTVFGTDAQRVANALLSVSAEEYAKVAASVREQGLAAKIAAAQNTGLKGALDALSSVFETIQILVYEQVQKPLGNAVTAIADFTNHILFGAGPALHTLRLALLGVGAGIAGILALRGAVEVLALLAKTIALAATPFGALVVAAGLIGGAFGFMSARGLSVVDILESVKTKLVDLGSKALDFVQPKLEKLREFFTGTALPAIERFGEAARDGLVSAFQATVSFVESKVIPVLRSFADLLTTVVIPAAFDAGAAVGRFAVGVASDIAGLAQKIYPTLKPVIDGFVTVGKAIGSAFTGDFSQLGSGFASLGSGFASAAQRIGSNIVTALAPVAKTVGNFFARIFTVDNFMSAVDAIGVALNFIARKIGQFITSPIFVSVVGVVAAGLVVIAGKWALAIATGLLEGLTTYLPQYLSNLGDLFINDILLNPKNLAIAAGVTALALTVGRSLVLAFRSAGEQGASGLLTGLKTKLGNAPSFLSTLFGGKPGNSIFGPIEADAAAFTKTFQGAINQARILGSTKVYDRTRAGLDEATLDIRQLKRGLSDSQIAALTFRDKLSSIGTLARTSFSGLGEIFGGLKDILFNTFSQFGQGGFGAALTRIKGGFKEIFNGLKTYVAEQGGNLGATLAKGIGIGLASVTTGAVFGQQLGSGGGILAALGLAGSAVGLGTAIGGPAGAVAGGLTAAVGLITAAFTSGKEAIKHYREDVDKIATAIDPALVNSLKAGKLSLDDFRNGLNFSDIGGDTSTLQAVVDSFVSVLSQSTKDLFPQLGTGLADFLDPLVKSGAGFDQINQKFLDLAFTSDKFTTKFGDNAALVRKAVEAITAPGGLEKAADLLSSDQNATAFGFTTDDLVILQSYSKEIDQLVGASGDLSAGLNKTSAAIKKVQTDVINTTRTAGTTNILGVLPDSLASVASSVAKISETPVFLDIPTSNAEAITTVTTALQEVINRKQLINSLFSTGILPPGLSEFGNALQQAAIGVEGLGKGIDSIAASGGFDFLTASKIDQSLRDFGTNVQSAFKSGFESGDIIDEASARAKLQPLFDVAATGASDETKKRLQDAFDGVIVQLLPVMEESKALDATQLALTTAQALADGSPIGVGITPPEIPMPAALATAQTQADAAPIAIFVEPPTIPADFISTTQATAAGNTAGANVGQGLANGLNSKLSVVRLAAQALANAAVVQVHRDFKISSPSKVFFEIGQFVAEGLANGITDGGDGVVSSVEKLIDDAIDSATGRLNDASKALRSGASTLFDAFFGSGNAAGGTRVGDLAGAVSQAFNGLGAALDSAFQQAADILAKSQKEALSRAEKDILGESPTSLNPGDVLGSANREAVVGALDSIIQLGKEMIEQGSSADDVTAAMSQYLAKFRALASEYGLNQGQVEELISQVGLSSDSLSGFVKTLTDLAVGLGQVTTDAQKLNDTLLQVFDHVFDNPDLFGTQAGVGNAQQAFAGVTTSFQGIRAALDSSFGSFRDAIAAGSDGTLVQKAIAAGGGPLSLDFNDVLGASNRTAFADAIKKIQDLGKALVAGGSSAEYAAGEMRNQREALINMAVQLGFNADQVRDLANNLGLSEDALNDFLKAVQAAKDAATLPTAAPAAPNTSPTDDLPDATDGPSNGGTVVDDPSKNETITVPVTVNLSLPYGDPEAIAIAVGNKVATKIRIIGG